MFGVEVAAGADMVRNPFFWIVERTMKAEVCIVANYKKKATLVFYDGVAWGLEVLRVVLREALGLFRIVITLRDKFPFFVSPALRPSLMPSSHFVDETT